MSLELGQGTGPLRGVKVVELAGIGPGPHACMILADLGADVIRIDRPKGPSIGGSSNDILNRGRPSVALDLKNPRAIETVLQLVEDADILIEGMRPGVTERLGLGPEDCAARNPRLVYGRMTGWGQTGPWSQLAGHDMNYIAITGALYGLGQDRARPHFPNNLLGDFGGGSAYLVIGLLAALLEAKVSGKGQVVDAAIVDGTAHLNAMGAAFLASGLQGEERLSGMLDGGSPYYDIYETADGRHMSVGSLEPQFYAEMLERLGIAETAPDRNNPANFADLKALFAATFKSKTQAAWAEVFFDSDACVAPVLPLREAVEHPHIKAREIFVERDGMTQPVPAPRFSRTEATLTTPPDFAGARTQDALSAWGIDDVDSLIADGVAFQA
ncbi:MAG TPA: CaiB/BaiF CoA-transferase family protein [Marmoricola sp.]|nr:CaiB/BaiF CoA-transferase family protein [Marmoricola sp.]